jgi:hypothetical protein
MGGCPAGVPDAVADAICGYCSAVIVPGRTATVRVVAGRRRPRGQAAAAPAAAADRGALAATMAAIDRAKRTHADVRRDRLAAAPLVYVSLARAPLGLLRLRLRTCVRVC